LIRKIFSPLKNCLLVIGAPMTKSHTKIVQDALNILS
jgi:hypothetical protein